MTVTVNWGDLNDALRTVSPVTGRGGGTLPIFGGVRLTPALDGIELCCTDGDLTITVHVDTPGATLQSTVVPARLFASIVGAVRGDVTIVQDDADLGLVVTSGKFTTRIRTMFADDFPQTTEAGGDSIVLTSDVRAKLGHILYAASRDGARPILTGVGFGDGHAVCTDSYRLAAVDMPDMPKCIIQARAIELALKQHGDVTLTVDDRRATFVCESTTITTRLIEGTFPNWQQLIPAETPRHITVDRELLSNALERVSVLVTREQPVRFQVTDDGLQLSVCSQDVGEASETIPTDSDFPGTIAFNGNFLADLLKSMDEAKVEIGLVDMSKPAVVRSGGIVSLLMPVRVP